MSKVQRVLARGVFAGVASALLLSNPAGARSAGAVTAFNEAVQYFNQQDYNKAVPLLDEAISKDPDFAQAYYARGACRFHLKGFDGAVMDLGDAVRLDPELLDARSLRGMVQYEANRWDQAMDDFTYVLNKKPNDSQALLGRGIIYLQREQTEEAEKDLRHLLTTSPEHPMAGPIRKLLAQLHGGAPAATPEAGAETAPAPKAAPTARASAARKQSAAAAARALGEAMNFGSHDISDAYGRKVLRGEGGEATGDIRSVVGPPK